MFLVVRAVVARHVGHRASLPLALHQGREIK